MLILRSSNPGPRVSAMGQNPNPSRTLACPVPPAADIVGERGPLVNQAREHAYRLPFEPFNWVDIVHAAPIPLAFDLRATRRCQMIEQVRQWVFRPIVGD